MDVVTTIPNKSHFYADLPNVCDPVFAFNIRKSLDAFFQERVAFCLNTTALHAAAFSGEVSKVKELVSTKHENLYLPLTPLMCAVAGGSSEAVGYLAEIEKDTLNRRDVWNRTALFYAVHSNADFVNVLLERGALAEEGSFFTDYKHFIVHDFITLIIHLSPDEFDGVTENELREHIAEYNAITSANGFNVVSYALALGNKEVVSKLINAGVRIHFGESVSGAIKYMSSILFKTILADSDLLQQSDISSLLRYVQMTGNAREIDATGQRCLISNEKLKFALAQLVRRHHPKNAQLLQAIIADKVQRVTSLIEGGMPLQGDDQNSISALVYVALVGSPEVLDACIKSANRTRTFPIDPVGPINGSVFLKTPNSSKLYLSLVHISALASNHLIVKELKKYGLNYSDANLPPLWLASAYGTPQTVATLLELGADPNAVDTSAPERFSPLCGAVYNPDQREVISLLFKHGVSLNHMRGMRYCNAQGPFVCNNRFIDGVLDSQIDLNRNGTCVLLHVVIRAGCITQARRLLDAGARADLLDDEGSTSIHCVADFGQDLYTLSHRNIRRLQALSSLIEVLKERGAQIDGKDSKNRTALEKTLGNFHVGAVAILFKNNASMIPSVKAMNECLSELQEVRYCALQEDLLASNFCGNHVKLLQTCLLKPTPYIYVPDAEFEQKILAEMRNGLIIGMISLIVCCVCCARLL